MSFLRAPILTMLGALPNSAPTANSCGRPWKPRASRFILPSGGTSTTKNGSNTRSSTSHFLRSQLRADKAHSSVRNPGHRTTELLLLLKAGVNFGANAGQQFLGVLGMGPIGGQRQVLIEI